MTRGDGKERGSIAHRQTLVERLDWLLSKSTEVHTHGWWRDLVGQYDNDDDDGLLDFIVECFGRGGKKQMDFIILIFKIINNN